MFRLVIFQGPKIVAVHEACSDSVTVGRDKHNTIVLDHPSVSRDHARIHQVTGGFEVVDVGSTNGVSVGGVRVKAAPLSPGAQIQVGEFTMHFLPDLAGGHGTATGQGGAGASQAAAAAAASADAAMRNYKALESLFLASSRLASMAQMEKLVGEMLDCLIDMFQAERGFVLMADPRTGKLVPSLARRIDTAGSEWPISQGIASSVFRSQKPVVTTDAQAQSPFSGFESVQRGELRSVVCVPLVARASERPAGAEAARAAPEGPSTLGVVYLDSRAANRVYGEADLKLLDTFAAHAAQTIASTRERESLKREVRTFKAAAREASLKEHDVTRIVAVHPRMMAVLSQVEAVAREDVSVLLLGESGTGKELIAKAIHDQSRRRDKAFVAVNCMALAADVIESELFGHERGAFTGALERRQGRFEMADGGTIFLDEIGELATTLQVKLLRVLQERQVERVGSGRPVDIDVRLIAATNADLKKLVKEAKFREDLYYRLNVFPVEIPPLRQRMEDVPALVEHFIAHYSSKMARRLSGIAPDALSAMMSYAWPGNVRELRNVLERAFVIERSTVLTRASLPFDIVSARGQGFTAQDLAIDSYPPDFHLAKELFEKNFILKHLRANGGNIARTASILGLPRKTIYRKLVAFGIGKDEFRDLAPEDQADDTAAKEDGPR